MTTTLAEQIQHAIDQGMPLDVLRRHFHLSESELRDYCSDILDDEPDDLSQSAGTGVLMRCKSPSDARVSPVLSEHPEKRQRGCGAAT